MDSGEFEKYSYCEIHLRVEPKSIDDFKNFLFVKEFDTINIEI